MSNEQPSHHGYLVEAYTGKDGSEKKAWTEIAAVWPHKRDDGFDVAFKGQNKGEGRIVCIVPERGLPAGGPSKRAYLVEEGKDGKKFWIEVGAVWPHKSGTGFDLVLKGGLRILCLENKPADAANDGAESVAAVALPGVNYLDG